MTEQMESVIKKIHFYFRPKEWRQLAVLKDADGRYRTFIMSALLNAGQIEEIKSHLAPNITVDIIQHGIESDTEGEFLSPWIVVKLRS